MSEATKGFLVALATAPILYVFLVVILSLQP